MRFKDFITRQRVGIFVIGAAAFAASLVIANSTGFASLRGELFVDLAASAVTIIFTALIIDYLDVREEHSKTKNAAGLAEDEIKATCFRIKWRMARLFGFERRSSIRDNVSNRQEAHDYLAKSGEKVDRYLATHNLMNDQLRLDADQLQKYLERLQAARTELEQTLLLYEYAMSYSLRERVLNLRSELQIADNILGFFDFSEKLNSSNVSLIRVLSQSIYEEVEQVLGHDSSIELGTPINEKDSVRV